MSKKLTKKNIAALQALNTNTNIYSLSIDTDDGAVVVDVQTTMTIEEKGRFIDRVVNSCFDMDGEFRPEYRESVFMITLMQMLTNVPVFSASITQYDSEGNETGEKMDVIDIDKTYSLCRSLDLLGKVHDDRFQMLINELQNLVVEKLVYRQQMQFSSERIVLQRAREEIESGVAMVNSIGEKLNETMQNFDLAKISEMSNAESKSILDRIGV